MRKLKDLLIVAIASTALIFAVGCADDAQAPMVQVVRVARARQAVVLVEPAVQVEPVEPVVLAELAELAELVVLAEPVALVALVERAAAFLPKPAAPETAAGDWAPASRVTSLGIPANPGAAADAGCDTVGARMGLA